jgi:hypothetical protein
MAATDRIPIPYLRECLSYDPESGSMRWRERPRSHFQDKETQRKWNIRLAHKEAGRLTKRGYRQIRITYLGIECCIYAHRAAWALMTGEYPQDEIAHDDINHSNNRFKNLKLVTHTDAQRYRLY